MNKGLIKQIVFTLLMALPLLGVAEGQIWKVVDEDGNVTYTDQKPADGSDPMDLPELSVIESQQPPATATVAPSDAEQNQAPGIRELRQMYRDFRITQPAQEETFWGTANTVVVAWSSSEPLLPDMKTMLYVDGAAQNVGTQTSQTLALERGEHSVYAELRDTRNRKIVTTDTVTFFVKQHSANF